MLLPQNRVGGEFMFIFLSFAIFLVAVFAIAWYKAKGTDNTETATGYFLAGRGLSGPVIAATMILTNLSTEQIIGLNGQSYATNMGPMAWEVTSCVALITLALIFLPRYLKGGITTIPDYLEERFDSTTKRIVSILFLVSYVVTYIPTVLYSGGLVLNQIFGISDLLGISTFQAVALTGFLLGVVGAIYTVLGGMKLAAFSDTVNGIGLLIGGLLVPILGILLLGNGDFVGGFEIIIATPEKLNAINPANAQSPLIPWPVLFTGLLFNNLFYWCTNQSIVQKALGASSLKEAQKGAILAGLIKVLTPAILVFPGIIAFAKYGDALPNADMAYPTLLLDVLPKPLLGIFAAILFGAAMSSLNGAMNSSSTLFTLDLYKPIINPEASDKQLVKVGQKFIIVVSVISVIVAPFILYAPSGLYNFLQECNGYFNVPILACVIVGFFTKRVPSLAAKAVFVVHIVLYTLSKFFLSDIHFLYVLGVLLPIGVIVMLIIGKIKPRETDFVQADKALIDMTPWKYAKPASLAVVLVMAFIYLLFSPIGLA
ncbi:transporter, SSS family [Clostridium perfringens]|jgi:SSS family solute:Na+ symporter|uniref:Transporter, SSS family n=10 Tax=Clostridium perfringens TaxID=1502 RepID=A0A133NDG9_CLOPF|nr:transporter, SSS family [Clostridium perfringens]